MQARIQSNCDRVRRRRHLLAKRVRLPRLCGKGNRWSIKLSSYTSQSAQKTSSLVCLRRLFACLLVCPILLEIRRIRSPVPRLALLLQRHRHRGHFRRTSKQNDCNRLCNRTSPAASFCIGLATGMLLTFIQFQSRAPRRRNVDPYGSTAAYMRHPPPHTGRATGTRSSSNKVSLAFQKDTGKKYEHSSAQSFRQQQSPTVSQTGELLLTPRMWTYRMCSFVVDGVGLLFQVQYAFSSDLHHTAADFCFDEVRWWRVCVCVFSALCSQKWRQRSVATANMESLARGPFPRPLFVAAQAYFHACERYFTRYNKQRCAQCDNFPFSPIFCRIVYK